MADLDVIEVTQPVVIIGSDSGGTETHPLAVNSEGAITSNRPVKTVTATFTGLSETLELDVSDGYATTIITADGIHTGSYFVEISMDGTTWRNPSIPLWSAASAEYGLDNTFVDGGIYYLDTTGIQKVRLNGDISSGTADITISAGEMVTGLLSQYSDFSATASGPIPSQTSGSGSLSNGSLPVILSVGDHKNFYLDITGTWTGSLTVQNNYTTAQTLKVRKIGSSNSLSSIVENGMYVIEPTLSETIEIVSGVATGTADIFYIATTNTHTDQSVWQAGTWNVGVTSSTLPTGAATEATLSTLNTKVPSGLTVTANKLEITGFVESAQYRDTFTRSSAGVIATSSLSEYRSLQFELQGTWSATVEFQASNDNTNWFNIFAVNENTTGLPVSSSTANGNFYTPLHWPFIRWNITSYTSGTVTVKIMATKANLGDISARHVNVTNTVTVQDGGSSITVDGSVSVIGGSSASVSSVSSSASSITLLSTNSSRKAFTLFNNSTQIAYVKFGTTASSTSFSIKMVAGAFYESPLNYYSGRIDAIWASADGSMEVTEIT